MWSPACIAIFLGWPEGLGTRNHATTSGMACRSDIGGRAVMSVAFQSELIGHRLASNEPQLLHALSMPFQAESVDLSETDLEITSFKIASSILCYLCFVALS
jgi:hypothetical protein